MHQKQDPLCWWMLNVRYGCRSIVATLGTRRYCNTGAKTRHGASARGQARLKHEINQLDGL